MLLPGTQIYIITFMFVSIELVIFFYLLIYKLARPDDKTTILNIVLIFLVRRPYHTKERSRPLC